jgi:hypothetical protein
MSPNRNWLFATAIAVAAFAATHAVAATEVHIDTIGYYNNAKIEITGPGLYKNADANAQKIVANFGLGPSADTFTVWGFCIDIFTGLQSGYFAQLPVDMQYHIGALTDDGNGHSLSTSQVEQIYGLAALGTSLINGASPDLQNKLSGIQGAIWTIEYPTLSFDGNTAALDAYIAGYVAMAPTLHGNAYALLSDDGLTQDFVIGVPEPATWAMMILGFGLIGLTLRSQRRRPVTT